MDNLRDIDIRILVFTPPLVGFGGFIVWLIVAEQLSNSAVPQAYFEMALGMACFVQCFAGFAEIYRREMPGPFGKVIRGTPAIISGIIIIGLFGFIGSVALIHGISILILR